eukprot:CAMPEP_0198111404 /NCGR_PEP_ID=MMETSP1442-20131203/3365_1 /TAXON_ID= /ORGANISM="Craspedostauros australis, Strain CCMP3328" /LENGTH=150 /DNA_ID=CAMNT_0043767819 /DNA_START=832 /DNA_END=1284 /DNA_ORIENTATION=-
MMNSFLLLCILVAIAMVPIDAFANSRSNLFFTAPISSSSSTGIATTTTTTTVQRTSTALHAWTMPTPSEAFGSFTPHPTWYDQVDNPAARRMIYDDDLPADYDYRPDSDMYFSQKVNIEQQQTSMDTVTQARTSNPIRRVFRWVTFRKQL